MRLAVVLSDLAVPARTGLQEQSLLLLEGLVAEGVEVDLFAFGKAALEAGEPALRARLKAPLLPMRIGWTLTGLRTRLFGLHGLEKRLAQYDVIYLEGAAAAGLLRKDWADRAIVNWIDPGSRRRMRFADAATGLTTKFREWAAAALAFLLEASSNYRGAAWVVVSESDADYLRQVHRHHETTAIPVMLPVLPAPASRHQDGSITLTVYADLREHHMWQAFQDLANRVLGPACDALPGLRIKVLGRLVPSSDQLALLPKLPVVFTGWSDDHLRELQHSDIVLLPDRVGTGLKNRAIQCLGLGCAIVGTSVAFESIPVSDGTEAMVVDAEEQTLEAVLKLGADATMRADMGASAKAFAAARYGKEQVLGRWLTLLKSRGTAR